jgi:hypothetical protein
LHTIADDQHTDHQFWINGGSSGVAVELCEMLAEIAQVKKLIDAAKEMVLWDVIFKIEE